MRVSPSAAIVTTLVLSAAGIAATAAIRGAGAQDPPKLQTPVKPAFERTKELRQFMRKKLDASSRILEGLVTENSTLVKAGAGDLATMCEAEEWRVSKDPIYRQFSDDFQRVTKTLGDAAETGDLDKARIRWMDVTMQCIDCHQFVRDKLIADQVPAPRKK